MYSRFLIQSCLLSSSNLTGGCNVGGFASVTVDRPGGDFWAYYPLANSIIDIVNGRNLVAVGGNSTTAMGFQCENAEEFRKNKYYRLPSNFPINNFSLSFIYRYFSTIYEQTFFSADSVLRFGLTWDSLLSVEIRFNDGSERQYYGPKIDLKNYQHIAFTFLNDYEFTVLVDGIVVMYEKLDLPLAPSNLYYIGQWQEASGIEGDMQDFRVFENPKSNEYFLWEADSYYGLHWHDSIPSIKFTGGSLFGGGYQLIADVEIANSSTGMSIQGNAFSTITHLPQGPYIITDIVFESPASGVLDQLVPLEDTDGSYINSPWGEQLQIVYYRNTSSIWTYVGISFNNSWKHITSQTIPANSNGVIIVTRQVDTDYYGVTTYNGTIINGALRAKVYGYRL